MFHEGKDLSKLFGQLGAPKGFPTSFSGFAGTGRSLKKAAPTPKPAKSGRSPSKAKSPEIARLVALLKTPNFDPAKRDPRGGIRHIASLAIERRLASLR